MKYRRKPEIIDAVEWRGDNIDEIKECISENVSMYNRCLFIGDIIPSNGEMVIKNSSNKIYKMSKDVFDKLYEEAKE